MRTYLLRGIAVLVTIAVAIAAGWGISLYINKAIHRRVEHFFDQYGDIFKVSSYQIDFFPPRIQARTLEMTPYIKRGKLLHIQSDRVSASIQIWPLFSGMVVIDDLEVIRPAVTIKRGNGNDDRSSKSGHSGGTVAFLKERIVIQSGVIDGLSLAVESSLGQVRLQVPQITIHYDGSDSHRVKISGGRGAVVSKNGKVIPVDNLLARARVSWRAVQDIQASFQVIDQPVTVSGNYDFKRFQGQLESRFDVGELMRFGGRPQFSGTAKVIVNYTGDLDDSHQGKVDLTLDRFQFERSPSKRFKINRMKCVGRIHDRSLVSELVYTAADGGMIYIDSEMVLSAPYPISGRLRFSGESLKDFIQALSVRTDRLDGKINGGGKFSGTLFPLKLTGYQDLNVDDFIVNHEPRKIVAVTKAHIRSPIDVTSRGITIKGTRVAIGQSLVQLNSVFKFKGGMDLQILDFDLSRLQIGLGGSPFRGSGKLKARIWGPYKDLAIPADLDLVDVSWRGVNFDALSGSVVYGDRAFELSSIVISKGDGVAKVNGHVASESRINIYGKRITEQWFGSLVNGSHFDSWASYRWESDVGITIAGDIRDPAVELMVIPKRLMIGGRDLSSVITNARIKYQNTDVEGLILYRSPDEVIQYAEIKGRVGDDVDLVVSGEGIGIQNRYLTGKINLNSRISGPREDPSIKGNLEVFDATVNTVPVGNSWLSWQGKITDLHLKGAVAKDAIVFTASLDRENYAVDLNLNETSLISLFEDTIDDQVYGAIQLHGKWQDIGSLNGSFNLHGVKILRDNRFLLRNGVLSGMIQNGDVQIKKGVFSWNKSQLTVTGGVRHNGRLDLTINGYFDLQDIPIMPKYVYNLRGESVLQATIGGMLSNPTVLGSMHARDVQFFINPIGMACEIPKVDLEFTDQRFILRQFYGTVGNGEFSAHGASELSGFKPTDLRFQANLKNIFIPLEERFDLFISGMLFLDGDAQEMNLTGDIKIDELRYFRPLDILSVRRAKPRITALAGNPFLNLGINVSANKSVHIKNDDLTATLSGRVKVIGTNQRYSLMGEVELNDGKITFRDNHFRFTRGAIKFGGAADITPDYDFVAETVIDKYKIQLNVYNEGTINRIDLISYPELSREKIITLLETGRIFNEFVDEDREFTEVDLSSWEIATLVSGPAQRLIEKELRRRTRFIDTFRLISTFSESTDSMEPVIVVGSAITDTINLTYKATITNLDEQSASLEYQVRRNFSLVSEYDKSGSNRRDKIGLDLRLWFEFQ